MTTRQRIIPTEPEIMDKVSTLILALILILVGIGIWLFVYPDVLSMGLGILLFGWGLLNLKDFLSLRNPEKPRLEIISQATIINRYEEEWEDDYQKKWRIRWVVFQFNTDDGQVTLKARVSKPFYEGVEPGITLAVRYNATDPQIALLEGEYSFDEKAIT